MAFAFLGCGTPAPFDPPRHLVVRGPYRYLRNPMYLGATLALAGASLFYEATALAAYAVRRDLRPRVPGILSTSQPVVAAAAGLTS